MNNKKVSSMLLSIILVASPFVIPDNYSFFVQQAEAQSLTLRVSAAEKPTFENHFFGPQIVQIIIEDPTATNADKSIGGLQVKGTSVPRVHLANGLWYSFIAERNAFLLLADLLSDGSKNGVIAVQQDLAFVNTPTGFKLKQDENSFIRDITVSGGATFIEIKQSSLFPTLPTPFFNSANPDVNIADDDPGTSCSISTFDTVETECDWPYIRLIPLVETDVVAIRTGSASVSLVYDDMSKSISSALDRKTYPVNAELIFSYTDFMWNINPVEEDVVSWVLDKRTGNPTRIIYQPLRQFSSIDAISNADFLEIFGFLDFDRRQVLELDGRGIGALRYFEIFDSITSTVKDGGGVRIAENALLVEEMQDEEFPVITMIETDPNTALFESLNEQAGGRAGIFAASRDRVVSFDYFDIINSAAIATHDGFASVDREVYDSSDRAVITVTDADLNMRSRVSESPSAMRSKSFIKIGNPFPLSNNPTFIDLFGKHTLNVRPRTTSNFDFASTPVDPVNPSGTFNRVLNDEPDNQLAPIRVARFLAFDPDSNDFDSASEIADKLTVGSAFPDAVTVRAFDAGGNEIASAGVINGISGSSSNSNSPASFRIDRIPPDVQIVVLDLNKSGRFDKNGSVSNGELLYIAAETDDANTTDIIDAEPFDSARQGRTQKIALDFRTPGIGIDEEKPSSIIVNSNVNLQDLNRFQTLSATGAQIINNRIATKPVGQAFPIDPFVMATAMFRTEHGFVTQGEVEPNTVYSVMVPEYNLINANFGELITGTDSVTGDRLRNIVVQIEAICPSTTSTCGSNGKIVRQLVDFTPFELADTDNASGGNAGLLGTSKIGTGSFRVVDFLSADWNNNGISWPNDKDEESIFRSIKLRFSIVTVGNNPVGHVNQPTKLIELSSHVMALDVGGIVAVIVPPNLLTESGRSLGGGAGTIDQITLIAREHLVYRIQLKEEGSNSAVFSGRVDFMTVNQFDTVQTALADIVLSGDPARMLIPNRFVPPNRLGFAYIDLDIKEAFRGTSASFIYETRDGRIQWDKKAYSFGQDAFITLIDQDLNKKPDARERYDVNAAGFVFFELGKQRVTTERLGGITPNFGTFVSSTFLETGPNTGIFVAQIKMMNSILVTTSAGPDRTQGTVDDIVAESNTQQNELEVNYLDVRDRSSIKQEFSDVANIRTALGDVVLDRSAYPAGAMMYIEIFDNDFNTNINTREKIDLSALVIRKDTIVSSGWGAQKEGSIITNVPAACDTFVEFISSTCANAAPIMEINIMSEGGKLVSLFPAGLLDLSDGGSGGVMVQGSGGSTRFGSGISTSQGTFNILPILDRQGNPVREATESGPNTGIFEFEVRLPGPAKEDLFPVVLPNVLTAGTLDRPIIKSNQPIQVTYMDPSDATGKTKDENEQALFLTNTARVATSKPDYNLGERVEFIIEEPDFNLDSRSIDEIELSVLDIITDKVDTEDTSDNFKTVVNSISSLRTNLNKFRETGFNTGVFSVAIEELTQQLVSRGKNVKLVYFDKTPSGGRSEIRVQFQFDVRSLLPEIKFDKEQYTPVDEVVIRIISPDSNQNPNSIETVRPSISSSSESLGSRNFAETGPNTGIFEENFRLTPNKRMFGGDLTAIREDGITVEFRVDSNTVVTKSAFVNYNVGLVVFDKDAYRMNERGILRVIDRDAGFNPHTVDTVKVRFWSTTDRGGLLVTLRETGGSTGIFEETVTFTADQESTGTRLRVSEGDTITAKYTDNTLPSPARLGVENVFTVQVEEVLATAFIGSIIPPLERAIASDLELVGQTGMRLLDFTSGSNILIQSEISNSQTKKQPFAYIVQVKDRNGITTSLSWITGELSAKDTMKASQSWSPTARGEFVIQVFVWQNLDNPIPLSPVRTTTITVA